MTGVDVDQEDEDLVAARADVERLKWNQSVSAEAEARRVESLARAVRELARIEREETA